MKCFNCFKVTPKKVTKEPKAEILLKIPKIEDGPPQERNQIIIKDYFE